MHPEKAYTMQQLAEVEMLEINHFFFFCQYLRSKCYDKCLVTSTKSRRSKVKHLHFFFFNTVNFLLNVLYNVCHIHSHSYTLGSVVSSKLGIRSGKHSQIFREAISSLQNTAKVGN